MKKGAKILWIFLGLLFGFTMALFVGVYLVFSRAKTQQAVVQAQQAATLSAIEWATSTPTPVITPNPDDEILIILFEAEEALRNLDLNSARELLLPLTEEELSIKNSARLYGDLGDLEIYAGHPRIASDYFEKQYAFEKTPDVLFYLAEVCYASGQLTKAMIYYEELINWEGAEADEYREMAEYYLNNIRSSIGTKVPE